MNIEDKKLVLKSGHPPESQLKIRISWQRHFVPVFAHYNVTPLNLGDWWTGPTKIDGIADAAWYEQACLNDNSTDPIEMFTYETSMPIVEVVDNDGTVWSEWVSA